MEDCCTSDSDADADTHDYVDGELPQALTSAYSVKSPLQRAAQLSADCMQVDGEIGLANPERRFLKRLFFEHVADREGKTDSTHAMVLIPTEDEPGLKASCLAEANMFKSGMYGNVPVPTQFVQVTKKAAFGAKRAMDVDWKCDKISQPESNTRFASSKVSRGQLGDGLHQEWMKDLVRVCNAKLMYICVYGSASGEIEVASLNVKTSVEATNANLKMAVWSHDPRKIFQEVGSARVLTTLGHAYMSRKLSLPGHTPVPDPGDKPERSRKMIKALLEKPLSTLHIDANGNLLVPTEDEVRRVLTSELSSTAVESLAQWREEFPRPETTSGAADSSTAGQTADSAPTSTADSVPCAGHAEQPLAPMGTKASKEDLETKFGLTQLAASCLPDNNSKNVQEAFELLLFKNKKNQKQIWIRNKSNKDAVAPIGIFLGNGGPGQFVSLVNNSIAEEKNVCLAIHAHHLP